MTNHGSLNASFYNAQNISPSHKVFEYASLITLFCSELSHMILHIVLKLTYLEGVALKPYAYSFQNCLLARGFAKYVLQTVKLRTYCECDIELDKKVTRRKKEEVRFDS